jgi:hypothetical protein
MSYVDPKLKANRIIFVLVISIVTLLLFGPLLYAGFRMIFPSHSTAYAEIEIPFSQLVNDVDYPGRVRDIRINGTEMGNQGRG